jgi:hypothetical protein
MGLRIIRKTQLQNVFCELIEYYNILNLMNHYHVFGKKLEVPKPLTWFTLRHLSSLYFVHRSKVGSIYSTQIITATSDVKFKLPVWWNIVKPLESTMHRLWWLQDCLHIKNFSYWRLSTQWLQCNYYSSHILQIGWTTGSTKTLDRTKPVNTKEGIVIWSIGPSK